jgi:general secretion pathway protein D
MAPSALRFLSLALALVTVASCSLLPPGMHSHAGDTATAQPAEPSADFGPTKSAENAKPDANVKKPAGPTGSGEPLTHYGSGVFVVQPAHKAVPPGPEEASLNFEGLDVREVAKVILGDYLKQSYTVHPSVQGTVTFRTVKPIAMKDLLPTLEMLLRQNGAAVVQENGIYKILPINMVRGSISPQLGGMNLPIPAGFGVLVVPLKYVGAPEMVKILEPFAGDNTVRADPVRNLVIIAGNQRELSHLVDTIEMFDVDWLQGYSVGVFPMKSVDVKTLMGDLDKIFGGPNNPLTGIVRVIPIERMNALVVVTTQPGYLSKARSWLEKIDEAGGVGGGGTRFFVYTVRNGKAENLAQLVGDLFSTRRTTTTAPTLAPGSRPTEIRSTPFGQPTPPAQTTTTSVTPAATTFSLPGSVTGTTANEVRVIADKDTNSLLILATPGDYEVILNALKQLDVTRRQVLVEVLLAEVKLTDNLQYGLDWYLRTRNNTIGSLNAGGGLNDVGSGGVGTSITGLPPTNFSGLQLINLSGTEVRAVLRAFGNDGKTKVLADPQIMVLDNEKAEIKVGDRISVQTAQQTGVSTGTGVVNSFQYLETGILLAVTPRINSGGMVTLEVNQEVSAPDFTSVTAANPNPNVSTRNAKTSVVVANGESVALGGLISENNGFSTSGIPLLSKIPVLGALFGTQNVTRQRTELVMVITPKIVSDPIQARQVTDELRDRLPSLERSLPPRKTGPIDAAPHPVAPEK